MFSIVAISICIPTNSARAFPFLPTLSLHSLFIDFFDDGHSDWYEVISPCFDLHFSNNELCCGYFVCLLAICISSLEKYLFRSFSHFFILLFVFLY